MIIKSNANETKDNYQLGDIVLIGLLVLQTSKQTNKYVVIKWQNFLSDLEI